MKYNSKERKDVKQKKEQILKDLPSFINKLLLLLNSGLVLRDAVEEIIESYRLLPENERGYFKAELIRILDESDNTGESVISGIYKFSRYSGVKELNRISNILMESQNRGTDLWDKLKEQSDLVWEERKRLALEKIHTIDSKMSFPMGLMLIALIIITIAPAMISM